MANFIYTYSRPDILKILDVGQRYDVYKTWDNGTSCTRRGTTVRRVRDVGQLYDVHGSRCLHEVCLVPGRVQDVGQRYVVYNTWDNGTSCTRRGTTVRRVRDVGQRYVVHGSHCLHEVCLVPGRVQDVGQRYVVYNTWDNGTSCTRRGTTVQRVQDVGQRYDVHGSRCLHEA